jgi:hypothetical protein
MVTRIGYRRAPVADPVKAARGGLLRTRFAGAPAKVAPLQAISGLPTKAVDNTVE